MKRNLAAFTPPGSAPPFISINQDEALLVSVTVRSIDGSMGYIEMNPSDLLKLISDADRNLKHAMGVSHAD